MARTNAISMLAGASTPATLAELYGLVVENVQKASLANALKNRLYTGNPAAGSVEYKRFVNASPKDYGSARGSGKGDKVTAPGVTVNLSTHKEIVEEVSKFDLDTFGAPGVMQRRADNHVQSMSADLDRAFFAACSSEGTAFTPTGDGTPANLEEMFQKMETIKNDYVDGVDRGLMSVVLSPAKYGEMRIYLDAQSNPNVDTVAEEFGMWHGVKVYSSTRLGEGVEAVLLANGPVAQPVTADQYTEPEKIPLSNDYAVSLFYDYGTKVLAPELVMVWSAGA